MIGYNKIRRKAQDILISELPKELYYHSVKHTLNVLKVCNNYIKREKIDRHNAKLLRIAALMHDIGFTVSNINHEERSKNIAANFMKESGFSKKDISIVGGLILATRIPQRPKSELEKIICDCDLDYLGRPDFYPISNLLFKELKFRSLVTTKLEWDSIQIKFLEAHKYHTKFALKRRQPQKEKRIEELKKMFSKLEND